MCFICGLCFRTFPVVSRCTVLYDLTNLQPYPCLVYGVRVAMFGGEQDCSVSKITFDVTEIAWAYVNSMFS